MTRYYNLRVHYRHNKNEGVKCTDYSLITRAILDATVRVFEEHYDSGFYDFLRIEYYIVQ